MYLSISRKINSFDNYILSLMEKYLRSKYLDILMPLVTSMGNLGVIWLVIAGCLSFNKSYQPIGGIVVLTLIISTTIGEGIVKHMVRRIRPCNSMSSISTLIAKPISYSFPSGHTLSSFAAAGVLSTYFGQYKLVFLAIAFLIALSRLYLNVHYPTDVVAGIILGLWCTKLIFLILQEDYLQVFVTALQNIL